MHLYTYVQICIHTRMQITCTYMCTHNHLYVRVNTHAQLYAYTNSI